MKNSVLVTGAKGNLGTVVCKTLADAGWNVHGVDTSDGDLTLRSDTERIVGSIQKPLKAVVHLVGGIKAGKPLEELTFEDFQSMLNLNLVTAVNVLSVTIPVLKSTGGGAIIAMGAQSVIHPVGNRAAYSAAKTAVVSLILSAAEEGKQHNIRANAILPSVLRTPANLEWASEKEARTWPTLEQVASNIAYLIDPSCGVSGAVIPMFGSVPF